MTSAEAVLVNSTNAPQQYLATTPTKRIRNRARSGSTSRKIRRTSGMSSPSSAAAAAAAAASGKSKPASARASASARTNSNADADATRIKKDASLTFEPCSLGLRRILGGPDDRKNDNGAHQQQQPARGELPAAPLIPIGPPIGLCKGMWLGRTPLSVLKAIKSHKSLDATWSARDMTDFRKKHASIYRQYALLGIDWGDQSNNSNSNINSNSNGLREVTKKKSLMAVSRKLLTVVDASDTTLTLQRGKEMETTPNQTEARIVDVAVIKRRESSRSSSSKANNAYDFVPPESRVVLHEGDILKILNSTYRYQVVRFHDRNRNRNRNGTTASAQAAAAAAAAGIETIDLAHASFSSSGSDNEREVRKPAAAGPKSSSSSSLSNPVGVAQSKRKLRPDRRSSASAMDRTVAMPDEGIASESNSPKSEEEDGKPRARPRARSEPLSPDRSQSGNDIIDLLDTSDSSSESSSSRSRSRSSSESNHGFDTPTTDRKRLLSVSIADNSENPTLEKKKTAKPATNSNSNSSSNIHDASTIRQSQSIGNGAASEIEIESKLDGTGEGASNECPASKTPTDQVTSSMQPKTGRSVKVKADNGLPAISARTGADPATTIRKSKRISNRAQHEERIVKTKTNLETTTTKIEKDNNGNTKNSIPSLRSRLSKPGLRIEKVILLDEVVSTTITTKGSTSKAVSKKTADKRSYGKLDELPVVCPVFKFWDPSWGSSTAVEKASPDPEEGAPPLSIVSSSSTSAPPSASPPRKRRKKQLPPRDLPVSLANIYWKSLNSSRPREGACYLHTTMVAANTIPSSSMCQQWMELLTWGPRRTVTNPKSPTGFFWDGPRMEHAAEVWKQALQTNPSLLLPRMIASAPGGPSEWWKTCLEYNDLLAENDRHAVVGSANAAASEEQTMHRAIGLLRMRSTRLETLIVLLKSNIAFEEEYYRYERIRNEREQKQASTTERVVRENNSTTTTNNNNNKDPNPTTGHESEADSSDDDDDADDEGIDDENEPKHSIAETEREAVAETLVFLREIRGVGAKPVLRLVAQTMARFWLENKEFLGYYNADDDDDDSSDRDHLWWSLWQERSEIVREMASQIMEVLRLMQDILHHTNDAVQQALLPRRTRKRKNASSSSGMTEKDIRDVVWSAMDLEVKQHQLHLPASSFQRKKPKPKRAANDEPTAIDCFLLDWLLALRTSLGDTLVANLAVQFGIAKDYNAVVAL